MVSVAIKLGLPARVRFYRPIVRMKLVPASLDAIKDAMRGNYTPTANAWASN